MTNEEIRKRENKLTFKYTCLSLLLLILISILSILILFLIGLNFTGSGVYKKTYKYVMDTSLLVDEYVSLDEGGKSFTYKSNKSEETYYVSIKVSSNSNAMIGSYIEKDYLFSSYGGNPNTLGIDINMYNSSDDSLVTSFTSIDYEIKVGNKDSNRILNKDEYNLVNINNVTYSSNNDIYLYSLSISVMI